MKFAADWYKSKTTWTAIIAVVTAIGGALTGELTIVQAASAVFGAIFAATIRDTLAKGGAK